LPTISKGYLDSVVDTLTLFKCSLNRVVDRVLDTPTLGKGSLNRVLDTPTLGKCFADCAFNLILRGRVGVQGMLHGTVVCCTW
jgi:hypothetical protein